MSKPPLARLFGPCESATMIRLHVGFDLESDVDVELSRDQAHYLLNVMRRGDGDEVRVFNGRDGEWRARIAAMGKREARLRLEARTRPQHIPPDLDLVQALVKRARLETIVEKAAEFGVRRVRLVTTRRTNADHVRLDRLQAIATEAAEQTGRLDVPLVEAPAPLAFRLQDWPPERRLMFCDEAGDDPSQDWGGDRGRAAPALDGLSIEALRRVGEPAPWAVLIGPEGGFDPEERAALRALPAVTPVSLGPRILRADTAAIAALTLWQSALGDWRRT